MAFNTPTPWLDYNPGLILRAIEGGSDAEIKRAGLREAARDRDARRSLALMELAQQQGLAQERLAQAERIAQMEDATRRSIEGQRGERADRTANDMMGFREARLALDAARAADLNQYRTRQNDIRKDSIDSRPTAVDRNAQSLERELMKATAEAEGLVAAANQINKETMVDPRLKTQANMNAKKAVAKAQSLRSQLHPDANNPMVLESEQESVEPGGSQSSNLRVIGSWKDGKFQLAK